MGLYDKLDEIEEKLADDGDNSEPREGVVEQEVAGSDLDETSNNEESEGDSEQTDSELNNEDENISDSGNIETEEEEKEEEESENSLQARLRIAEKQKRDLEAQLTKQQRYGNTPEQQVVNEPVKQEVVDPEPNRQENYEEWLEWKDRQIEAKTKELDERLGKFEETQQQKELRQQAEKEFVAFENQFKTSVDDYEQAANHLKMEIAKKVFLDNPMMSEQQVMEGVNHEILRLAGFYYNEGYNPSEALYHLSHNLGYQKTQEVKAKEETEEHKPDLKQIAKNKNKSASPLTAGGKGGQPSVGSLKGMTNAQKAKLTDAEWQELLEQGS